MKKFLLLAAIGLFSFVSCDKDDDNSNSTESLSIEVDSGGGVYTFAENEITVLSAPNDFVAEVTNNTIVGNYAGSTSATIKCGSTEYNCSITVSPSYTYYVDMAIYLGLTQTTIENLYGDAISSSDSGVYLYNPLSSYFNETAVAFIYENGVVKTAASYFTFSKASYVINHLQQRYATYGVTDNVAYFGNAYDIDDCSILVAYDYSSTSYTFVMYMEYTSSKSSNDSMIDTYNSAFNSIME